MQPFAFHLESSAVGACASWGAEVHDAVHDAPGFAPVLIAVSTESLRLLCLLVVLEGIPTDLVRRY
jgi:hypothetical protein